MATNTPVVLYDPQETSACIPISERSATEVALDLTQEEPAFGAAAGHAEAVEEIWRLCQPGGWSRASLR